MIKSRRHPQPSVCEYGGQRRRPYYSVPFAVIYVMGHPEVNFTLRVLSGPGARAHGYKILNRNTRGQYIHYLCAVKPSV